MCERWEGPAAERQRGPEDRRGDLEDGTPGRRDPGPLVLWELSLGEKVKK